MIFRRRQKAANTPAIIPLPLPGEYQIIAQQRKARKGMEDYYLAKFWSGTQWYWAITWETTLWASARDREVGTRGMVEYMSHNEMCNYSRHTHVRFQPTAFKFDSVEIAKKRICMCYRSWQRANEAAKERQRIKEFNERKAVIAGGVCTCE